jgi:hypothetical protein
VFCPSCRGDNTLPEPTHSPVCGFPLAMAQRTSLEEGRF